MREAEPINAIKIQVPAGARTDTTEGDTTTLSHTASAHTISEEGNANQKPKLEDTFTRADMQT